MGDRDNPYARISYPNALDSDNLLPIHLKWLQVDSLRSFNLTLESIYILKKVSYLRTAYCFKALKFTFKMIERLSLSLSVHGLHRCQPSIRALEEPNHPRDELLKENNQDFMVQCSVVVQNESVYFLRQLSLSRDAERYPDHMNLWISLHDRK